MKKIRQKDPVSLLLAALVYAAIMLVGTAICLLIGYILVTGIPHLTPSLFSLTYTSENVSLLPALINTLFMVLLSLILALPLGVGAAIYSLLVSI